MRDRFRKALKNYSSTIDLVKVENDIREIILDFGGTGIVYEYDNDRKITEIYFKILIKDETRIVKMPLNTDKVYTILKKQKVFAKDTEKTKEKAYRTALANIRDWLDAQLTIYYIGTFEFPQIFLPYMQTKSGTTVYEVISNNNFKLGMNEET